MTRQFELRTGEVCLVKIETVAAVTVGTDSGEVTMYLIGGSMLRVVGTWEEVLDKLGWENN